MLGLLEHQDGVVATPEVELVGGLFDGQRSSRSRLPAFGWPDKRGRFRRRSSADAPTLYRRAGTRSGVVVYEAAPGWRWCDGCGVLHAPADACTLCGHPFRAVA